MITSIGGIELSRRQVMAFIAADAEAAREQRARDEAAAAREEEAQASLQRYYAVHGEYPWVTQEREREALARREAAQAQRAQAQRAEERQALEARLMMEGRRPRTVAEVLAALAAFP